MESSAPPKAIQGEGPHSGKHCCFIRLYDCNLTCRWCDTSYTWANTKQRAAKTLSGKQYDKELERHTMTATEVLDALEKCWNWHESPTNIVISGGEPMLQQEALLNVMMALDQADCPIHIETAGTITPVDWMQQLLSHIVVSPKLANSGKPQHKPS